MLLPPVTAALYTAIMSCSPLPLPLPLPLLSANPSRLLVSALLATLGGCSDYGVGSLKEPSPAGDTAACPEVDTGLSAEPAADCQVVPQIGVFDPVVEWQWLAQDYGYDDVMSTPVVGDISGDGVPDIVFSSFAGGAYTLAGALTAISGDGSGVLWSILDAGGWHPHGSAGVAIGDLDGDGAMEVCAAGAEVPLLCVNGDGTLRWAAGATVYGYGFPAFADLDGDGQGEVLFGAEVFGADGALRWTGAGSPGRWMSFAADVDGDDLQEVIAGNTVYNADGTIRLQAATNDGMSAIGDFDLDGSPEVVVVGSGLVSLYDMAGAVRWSVAVPGGGGGPPTVADFDGDGLPEVGVAGAYSYTVFNEDGAVLWSAPVQDYSSSVTGSSVFDFEGDGLADVVYADEVILWVYDGATGAVKLQQDSHASGTLYEYPLIVDVDADGATEIVLASNNYGFPGWNGITVIGDLSGSWRPSGTIWNQHAWSITNVLADGGLPADPEQPWVRFNSFRAGGSIEGRVTDLADVAADAPEVCCTRDGAEFRFPVYNRGLIATGDFLVEISVDGDVARSETLSLAAGEGRLTGPVVVEAQAWGRGLRLRLDGRGAVEECTETDNTLEVADWPCGE